MYSQGNAVHVVKSLFCPETITEAAAHSKIPDFQCGHRLLDPDVNCIHLLLFKYKVISEWENTLNRI